MDGGASKEASPSDQPLATEAERDTDKTARIQVLLRLIKLACMMVSSDYSIHLLLLSRGSTQIYVGSNQTLHTHITCAGEKR